MLCTSSCCQQVGGTVPEKESVADGVLLVTGPCWLTSSCDNNSDPVKNLEAQQINCGYVWLHSHALALHRLQFSEVFAPGRGNTKTAL